MELLHAGLPALLKGAVLTVALAISVVTDLRHGKVFDRVTLPCIVAGVLLNTLFAGLTGTGASLAGMATAIGLALVTTLIAGRGLGGGDVKLLAAVGALQGPGFALWTCAFAALVGPFLCLVPLVRSGLLGYTLRNFAQNAVGRFVMGAPVQIVSGSRAGKQPFSVAIALGVILTFVIR